MSHQKDYLINWYSKMENVNSFTAKVSIAQKLEIDL